MVEGFEFAESKGIVGVRLEAIKTVSLNPIGSDGFLEVLTQGDLMFLVFRAFIDTRYTNTLMCQIVPLGTALRAFKPRRS